MESNKNAKEQKDRRALISYVHLLRYGPSSLRQPGRVYADVKCIARLLGISSQMIRKLLLCRAAEEIPEGNP